MTKLWALLALLALLTAGTYYGTQQDKQTGEVSAKDDGNVPPPWP